MKTLLYLIAFMLAIVYLLNIEDLYSFQQFFEDLQTLWTKLFPDNQEVIT